MPPVKGRPRKLPHYANLGKTSSSGGELASARSCFSTVRTALGKLRITGLLAQFDIARSFPQFPRPLLLQPTILTSERGTRFGIRKAPNHVPPPHLPDDPKNIRLRLRAADGTVAENLQFQLVANGHRPQFLSEFFQTTSVVAGRVEIEADQPIFGTALTLTEGQISTLPLEAARVEYAFRTDAADGTVTLGKITLWAEGFFIKGFLDVTEEDGVAVVVSPVPVGGRLQDGVLRLAFALSGQFFERSVVGIEFQSFSFDQAQLQGELAEILVDEEEVSTGVVKLTRVSP